MRGLETRNERGQSSKSGVHNLKVVSTCRFDKISSIFDTFNSQKVQILSSIGFGGLLKLPLLANTNRELCLWLYQRLDCKNKCLHLGGGVDLHFSNADVNLVLSIPFKGRSVHSDLNQTGATVSAFKRKICSVNSSSSLTMSLLEEILREEYSRGFSDADTDAFKIACVLLSVCYFLAPEMSHEFPHNLIRNFVPTVMPGDINWAEFLISTLDRASYDAINQVVDGRNTITLFGCSLFLQV